MVKFYTIAFYIIITTLVAQVHMVIIMNIWLLIIIYIGIGIIQHFIWYCINLAIAPYKAAASYGNANNTYHHLYYGYVLYNHYFTDWGSRVLQNGTHGNYGVDYEVPSGLSWSDGYEFIYNYHNTIWYCIMLSTVHGTITGTVNWANFSYRLDYGCIVYNHKLVYANTEDAISNGISGNYNEYTNSSNALYQNCHNTILYGIVLI